VRLAQPRIVSVLSVPIFQWRTCVGLALGAAVGVAFGIGGYTFIYARGASYLTDDAAGCANCHIMRSHYDSWIKSTHKAAAVCNDCHTPEGLLPKYATKASNGFWHSFAFTTGRFPEPIRIKPPNREVTEAACRRCHEETVEAIEGDPAQGRVSCVRCHASVGHL